MIILLFLILFNFQENNPGFLYLEAQKFFEEGNLKKAEELLSKAIEQNPDSNFLKIELAKIISYQNQLSKALKLLKSFNPSEDLMQDYYSLKFYLDLMLNDFNGAFEDYNYIKNVELTRENFNFIIEAIQNKFLKYLSEKDPNNFIKLLKIYLEYFPNEKEIQRALLNLYIEAGNFEDANDLIKNIELDEDMSPLVVDYLYYLFEKNDCKNILELKEKFKDSNSQEVLMVYPYCFLREGNLEDTISTIEKILKINPKNELVLSLLFEIKLIEGDYKGAKEILEILPKENEKQVNSIRINEALYYQIQGEYKLAEEIYFKLLNKFESKERINVLKKLYNFYKDIGDCEKTLEYSLKIQDEDKDDIFSYYRIAEAYLISNDIENGLFFLNLYNEFAGTKSMVDSIWLLLEYGYLDEAYYLIKELENQKKDMVQINQLWGFYFFKKDEIEQMEKVLRKDLDDASSLNLLGYFLIEKNQKLDEAISLIEKALKLKPNNGSYLDSLGWGYYKKGEYKKAYEILKRAIFLEPYNGIILSHIGDVCLKLEKYEEALIRYKQALSFQEPNMPNVLEKMKEALAALYKKMLK